MSPQGAAEIRSAPPSEGALLNEVLTGLRSYPKRLHPKYFYDEVGSELFERITQLPEYYLTRTEISILKAHLPAFAHPAFGLLASAAAWAVVGASRLGAFLWEGAFVARARDAGLTKSAMRAVLEDTDARILAFERQAGVTRLMLAAGIVLAGAVAAWWSQRDR